MAKRWGRFLVQTGNGYLEYGPKEIVPFHGWVNRIVQEFLLAVGCRLTLLRQQRG